MSVQLLPVPLERQSHSLRRLPRHIGFIPDGNRRWAVQHGLAKEQGYASGIAPGLALFEACKALGVEEVSVYGFTQDNTQRPTAQVEQFRSACVAFAQEIFRRGAALLVLGDERSKQFPVSAGTVCLCRHFRARRAVARFRAAASGRCTGLVAPTGPDAGRLKTACTRMCACWR
jgi:undecaprenyl pyrophosphate synthase